MVGEQARLVFFLSLLFSWTKKVTKKSRQTPLLRRLCRANAQGKFVVASLSKVGKGKVLESSACLAGQREALCPALHFFFPYFFSWTKKVTKKSRTKEWLPESSSGQAALLSGQRTCSRWAAE
ncbi:MAG: hypothetical protein IPH18_11630 [Chitinophagaceae bacterium]|nr:hypothetical protein [Chitinophagaceae bacterium]